jgi:nicotinamidase-related amidase
MSDVQRGAQSLRAGRHCMSAALIIVDMLNSYEHEDADPLMDSVRQMLPAVEDLIDRAREEEAMVVYVNDNSGDWSAARAEIVELAMNGRAPELIEPLIPPPGTPFVVKARHSIFYQTQLEYLLRQEQIDRLILAGQVTEQCVLYSALDAYVRHFELAIPSDCVAHIREDLAQAALKMMESNMRAHVVSGRKALAAAREPVGR